MKPEIKTMWIEALRSGKYEQGVGCLECNHYGGKPTYCCLGVLAKEMGRLQDGYVGNSSVALPLSLLQEIGMTQGQQESLIVRNDGRRGSELFERQDGSIVDINPTCKNYTFAEIADYIEKNL